MKAVGCEFQTLHAGNHADDDDDDDDANDEWMDQLWFPHR